MCISGNVNDLRVFIVGAIIAVIGQGFMLFATSWNLIAVIACIFISILLLIVGIINWLYFNRKIILDAYGCTFVSKMTSKKFGWEEINLQYTENSSYLYGVSEIIGPGIILSAKPISKTDNIGAMTYCRFTHPSLSVFIRFSSSRDRLYSTSAKYIYWGYVANKEDIFNFLDTVNIYNLLR